MSIVRPVLFALAAVLLSAPSVSHARDDEPCKGLRVFNFTDAYFESGKVVFTGEYKCVALDGPGDVAPLYTWGGDWPEVLEEDCTALRARIDRLRDDLREARAALPGAEEALDTSNKVHEEYLAARAAWQAALAAVAAAKANYEAVHGVDTLEIERNGHVVVTRQVFFPETAEGRAVHDAMQREQAARRVMNNAWNRWSDGASAAARAAQVRVDELENVIDTFPKKIKQAEQLAELLGCP